MAALYSASPLCFLPKIPGWQTQYEIPVTLVIEMNRLTHSIAIPIVHLLHGGSTGSVVVRPRYAVAARPSIRQLVLWPRAFSERHRSRWFRPCSAHWTSVLRGWQALEARIAHGSGDFKAAHLAEVLWGLGTLGHVPGAPVFPLLLERVAAAAGQQSPFGFSGKVRSFE